jgi:hypothetical protein
MIKTQCRLIRTLLWLCFVIQFAFFILAWSSALPGIGSFWMRITPNGLDFEQVSQMALNQRFLGVALGLPSLLVLSFGLWRLDRMLFNFQNNAMFALSTIAHLRAFAGATALAITLDIVVLPIRSILFNLMLEGKIGHMAMGISSEQLLLILVCGLFYLITNMMHESRRLAEENEGFV